MMQRQAVLRSRRHGSIGVTLVELMIGVAVLGILAVLVAPSFVRMIETQRLRSITSQLATDLQYARAEAHSRGEWVRMAMRSNSTMTCYTIFTSTSNLNRCDCLLGAGSACSAANTRELRTVQIPRSLNVTLSRPSGQSEAFAFDNLTGGIASIPTDSFSTPINLYRVISQVDASRTLWTSLNRAGRVTVCAPTGSTIQEPSC